MTFDTTGPGRGRTQEPSHAVPEYAVVVAECRSQPNRLGECALVYGSDTWLFGRGGAGNYLIFFRQLPGEPAPPRTSEVCLMGETLSRLQAEIHVRPNGLEIRNLGQIPMFVNGKETSLAIVTVNDRVHFENEVILVVALRPRVLPALKKATVHHELGEEDEDGMVGECPDVWEARDQIAIAAEMDDPVLVLGETGTGKELVATAIHRRSKRAGKEMVTINASVVTETLNQQNFFGNLRGFPNSDTPARQGYFSEAAGSSLFLDEVGDCPRDIQRQLLRAIQQGEYQVLGEPVARKADVRVIGATNQDRSMFRKDFHGRFPRRVFLPPLRERREDIALLFRRLVLAYVAKKPELRRLVEIWPSGKAYPRISARLIDYVLSLPIVRNVRDLQALVTRAVDDSAGDRVEMFSEKVLRKVIEPEFGVGSTASVNGASEPRPSLAPRSAPRSSEPRSSSPGSSERPPSSPRREDPTKAEMLACLEREWWNVRQSARALEISEPRFYRLMERYGIKRP